MNDMNDTTTGRIELRSFLSDREISALRSAFLAAHETAAAALSALDECPEREVFNVAIRGQVILTENQMNRVAEWLPSLVRGEALPASVDAPSIEDFLG